MLIKHLKLTLIITFIIAFFLGVSLTVANIVLSASPSSADGDYTNKTIIYNAPVIKNPLQDSIINSGLRISIDTPNAIGLLVNVRQYTSDGKIIYDKYNFEKRFDGWYKINESTTGTQAKTFYNTGDMINIDWKSDKYLNGYAVIYANGWYPNGNSYGTETRFLIKKYENTTDNSTQPSSNNLTDLSNSSVPTGDNSQSTLSNDQTKENIQTTTNNKIELPPGITEEQRKRIVFEYVKKYYPKSSVSEHLDKEKIVEMISSPIDNNVKVDKAEISANDDNSKVLFKGKAEPEANVVLYIFSDPLIISVKADKNGDWEYVLEDDISEGDHEVFVTISDQEGKTLKRSEPMNFFVSTARAANELGITTQKEEKNIFNSPLFKYSLISALAIVFVLIAFFLLLKYEKKNLKKKLSIR